MKDRESLKKLVEMICDKALEEGMEKEKVEEERFYKLLMLEELCDDTLDKYTNAILLGEEEDIEKIIPVVEEEIGCELPNWLKSYNYNFSVTLTPEEIDKLNEE